jgi:hypothetical protein
MPRSYAVTGTDTNTAGTTQMGVTSAASVRPQIFYLAISSATTPADNAGEYFIQRYTAAGTSTAVTPQTLDPGDPASVATAGVNHSAEPTYTSGAILLRIATNQRATYQWYASPGGNLVMPATASNGLGLLANAVGGSAVAMAYTIHFTE